MISKHDVKSGQVEISDFKLRTVEEHNSFVQEVQTDGSLQNVNGVKRECVLSKPLSFFHPVTGFPPDALHDFWKALYL